MRELLAHVALARVHATSGPPLYMPEERGDVVHLVEALDLLLDERGLLVDELLLRQLPRHQLLDQDRLRRLVVAVHAERIKLRFTNLRKILN